MQQMLLGLMLGKSERTASLKKSDARLSRRGLYSPTASPAARPVKNVITPHEFTSSDDEEMEEEEKGEEMVGAVGEGKEEEEEEDNSKEGSTDGTHALSEKEVRLNAGICGASHCEIQDEDETSARKVRKSGDLKAAYAESPSLQTVVCKGSAAKINRRRKMALRSQASLPPLPSSRYACPLYNQV